MCRSPSSRLRATPGSPRRGVALGLLAVVTLAGCAATSQSTATGTTEAGRSRQPSPATSEFPGGARPSNAKLAMIEPDAGVAPVISLLNSATDSIDISVYDLDPGYGPITRALLAAQDRGVKVRVLISRTQFPLSGPQPSPDKVAKLQALGLDAQLSRPQFSYSHEKAILVDAGTPDARALVADFNLALGYFGHDPAYPKEGETRGMAVLVTNPADVAEISTYFNSDWPPYQQWPASTRPNLLWSPSQRSFTNPGNSTSALLQLIAESQNSLDLYVQELPIPAILFDPLVQRAQDGLTVRIISNDGGVDSEAVAVLTAAGVKLVYSAADPNGDGKPLYIHTKSIVADGGTSRAVAYVGSINPFVDQSLQTERELGVFVTETESVSQIQTVFNRDFASARPA
ncbi:MAG TPA: phospholipase D-like domain-containing protein [Actinomycetota bacterium]|nr:phospholipase D-like domain-containing protein [Actinomycetota bacterium]